MDDTLLWEATFRHSRVDQKLSMDFLVHLDGTAAVGQDEPSIFEVIAEEKMHELLKPAFDYMIAQATERYYALFPLYKFKNAVYLIFMSTIELQYLKKWGGSFTETFYGLKRSKGTRNSLFFNLIEIVWFPVVKSQLGAFD
jgi:hypothetical protein